MKKILVLSCIVLLSNLLACSEDPVDDAGNGTISGKVVSSGDNVPLENVKIETSPISNTVFTNEAGEFIIEHVKAGEYSVQAQLEGYITNFKGANVQNGQTSNVVFELKKSDANNQPPSIPVLVAPAQDELLPNIEAIFVWSCTDPDEDTLTYTIELRNDVNNEVLLFEDITDTTYVYSPLLFGAKYFWQVSANDGVNEPVISPMSSFEVEAAPVDNRFLFSRKIGSNRVLFSAHETGEEFQLTTSSENSFRPRRNVAANKIAFLKTEGSQSHIFTMNRDGSGITQVTSSVVPNGFNLNEINFCWPNNSDKIYFPSYDKLYRINSNGQGLELVYQTTDGSLISEVDVNIEQNMIALKTNDINGYQVKIFVISLIGAYKYEVLSGIDGAVSGLHISANGQKILYARDVSGFENSEYRRLESRIFLYDVASSTATDISGDVPPGTNDLDPRFSPNEAYVIFTNTSNDGISPRYIYSLEIGASGSNRNLLFEDASMPDWK